MPQREGHWINEGDTTQVWLSDLAGIIPSITGKIELVYEGEQEGPYQVALNLLDKAIRTQFTEYFPNPDSFKKKIKQQSKQEESPYKAIANWFDAGNNLSLLNELKDEQKVQALYKVAGLHSLVKKYFNTSNEKETGLLMELVLHGLAAYSLINKKMIDGRIEFKDLMGSMLNIGSQHFDEEGFNEEDFN